jgi:hypothetical protein
MESELSCREMCAKIVGDALWRSINCRFPVQPFHVHCVAPVVR